MKLLSFADRIIQSLENPKIGFGNYLLTFIFILCIRNFIETFSDNETISFKLFSHYTLFYFSFASASIVLFYYATRNRIENIARVVLPFFLILILAPVLDLALSLGKGYDMSYMLPGSHDNLLKRFITFFGPIDRYGVTPGIRIEIGIILCFLLIYFYSKSKNLLRSVFFTFLTYCLFFCFGIAPFIVDFLLSCIGLQYEYSALLMRNFYLFLMPFLFLWLYFLHNRTYCLEILKDLRYLRILHFVLMFALGIVLSPKPFEYNIETVFHLFFFVTALVYASLFSLITNNLVDYDIDKISNPNRPLVKNAIPTDHYNRLAWISIALAVLYSLAAGFVSMFFIIIFIGIYYLYSMPPFRMKRIPIFSKMLIAFNSLVLFMSGYIFMGGPLKLPFPIIAFALIGFTAVINFIDIKDYEGDKQVGIRTLPTMLGLKWGKLLIGLFFVVVYPLSYFVLNDVYLLLPSIVAGLIVFFLINRKNYVEWPVFCVYLISIIVLIGYLVVTRSST